MIVTFEPLDISLVSGICWMGFSWFYGALTGLAMRWVHGIGKRVDTIQPLDHLKLGCVALIVSLARVGFTVLLSLATHHSVGGGTGTFWPWLWTPVFCYGIACGFAISVRPSLSIRPIKDAENCA